MEWNSNLKDSSDQNDFENVKRKGANHENKRTSNVCTCTV